MPSSRGSSLARDESESPVSPYTLSHLGSPVGGWVQFSSVQSLSRVWFFATPWIAARQASLSITNSRSSLKLMCIKSVMPSSHLILCRPLLLLPPILPSITVFSSESTLRMRWPKYWSFSFTISPSNEHPGLISFRMDWLDLFAVQGTLKSLLQHHSSKASVLRRSAFFTVPLVGEWVIRNAAVCHHSCYRLSLSVSLSLCGCIRRVWGWPMNVGLKQRESGLCLRLSSLRKQELWNF